MRPMAARRTRSHTVANETADDDDDNDDDDDDEAPVIESASEHSLSDSLHQRDSDDEEDDDEVTSWAPFEPGLTATDAEADADDVATMPHALALTQTASTVGTCA